MLVSKALLATFDVAMRVPVCFVPSALQTASSGVRFRYRFQN